MRILIVLGHNRLTGVNTWAYTLAKEFISNGHEAEIEISSSEYEMFGYVNDYEKYYDILKSYNITYYVNTKAIDYDNYDAIILNYGVHASKLNSYNGKKIYVLHGMPNRFDGLYKPPNGFYKIAVSQFLYEWWDCDTYITNGIDLDFFKPADLPVINPFPKKIFCFARGFSNVTIRTVLYSLGAEIAILGEETPTELVKSMHSSDLVIAYGRSCYEAMACGKPVFVAGDNLVDGWVNPQTFPVYLYKNCSGYLNRIGSEAVDKIKRQLERYNPHDGIENRVLAEKYLSSKTMYDKYVKVIGDMQ